MKNDNKARSLIASNVRRLRLDTELSQEALAEKCGFHRTYISQLERERTNITIDNLERIAVFFKVEPAQLLKQN